MVGQGVRPDELGHRLELVGLGEQAKRPRPPLAQAGSPLATCQAAISSASREKESRQLTAG